MTTGRVVLANDDLMMKLEIKDDVKQAFAKIENKALDKNHQVKVSQQTTIPRAEIQAKDM